MSVFRVLGRRVWFCFVLFSLSRSSPSTEVLSFHKSELSEAMSEGHVSSWGAPWAQGCISLRLGLPEVGMCLSFTSPSLQLHLSVLEAALLGGVEALNVTMKPWSCFPAWPSDWWSWLPGSKENNAHRDSPTEAVFYSKPFRDTSSPVPTCSQGYLSLPSLFLRV